MLYLYLDESGDLGFDFKRKRPSRFFTVSVLAVHGVENNRRLHVAVRRTVRSRLHGSGRQELKAAQDSLAVKMALYRRLRDVPFSIFAVTVDKHQIPARFVRRADAVYNLAAVRAVKAAPLSTAVSRVTLVVDRSKGKKGIREFNDYMLEALEGATNPTVPVDVLHNSSHENHGLQAADLFAWGVFRCHERGDERWYRTFTEKVAANVMLRI